MIGAGGWHWDRRGKIALAALAGFQPVMLLAGKLDAALRSRRINEAIEAAEGGERALAFAGGVLRAASSGYWVIWSWLLGSAVLLTLAVVFRPRRAHG